MNDKQNVVHTYHTILFNLKKEGNSDTRVDESWGHYAKWSKLDTKGQIFYDSINIGYLK